MGLRDRSHDCRVFHLTLDPIETWHLRIPDLGEALSLSGRAIACCAAVMLHLLALGVSLDGRPRGYGSQAKRDKDVWGQRAGRGNQLDAALALKLFDLIE